ncbi:hypothetical protein ACWCQN_37840 [Streptomyces sp. NPDC001984]
MAFTPRTWVVGEVVGAAQLNSEIRDQFNNRFLAVRKTADTPRATATLADDPHLSVTVEASAVYQVESTLFFYTTDEANADLNLDWTVPAGATGRWAGFGQGTDALAGVPTPNANAALMRTVSSAIDTARSYGALIDTANPLTVHTRHLLVTSSAGTFALSWARTAAAGTVTLLQNSYMTLQRIA